MLTKTGAPTKEPLSILRKRCGGRGRGPRRGPQPRLRVAVGARRPRHPGRAARGSGGCRPSSGCGSTLLELLCGLREPDGGSVTVGGEHPAGVCKRCAYMPQRDLLLPWFSAIDNAALALRNGEWARAGAGEAAPSFARFGLGGFEIARPAELSGGMRQRVAFVRTLVPDAGAAARRALRLARRDDAPPCRNWLAGAGGDRWHDAARDALRRGGALARRPGRRRLAPPGRHVTLQREVPFVIRGIARSTHDTFREVAARATEPSGARGERERARRPRRWHSRRSAPSSCSGLGDRRPVRRVGGSDRALRRPRPQRDRRGAVAGPGPAGRAPP